MINQSGSSKPLVLALTLLISLYLQYHVTNVCGTTIPTSKPNGGGTTTSTSKLNITTNAARNLLLLQQVDSPASMRIISTSNVISTKSRNNTNTSQQSDETILNYRNSRNVFNNHPTSTRGTDGTANLSSVGINSKFLLIHKLDDSAGPLKVVPEDLGTSARIQHLHKFGEEDATVLTKAKEVTTTRYYHNEEDTTGTSVKGRKYSKHRNHYKQTNKDGPNSGTASHHTMASEPIDSSTVMMAGNPNSIKGITNNNAPSNKRKKDKTDLMTRILPMMIMPFLISTSLIPMMLTSLKFMLLKSLFVGKIAIVLLAINALWRIDNKGGVYSHNVHVPFGGGGIFGGGFSGGHNDRYVKSEMEKDLNMAHYGYNGDAEYGAYVNHRS